LAVLVLASSTLSTFCGLLCGAFSVLVRFNEFRFDRGNTGSHFQRKEKGKG
jgi:hypothetical protein